MLTDRLPDDVLQYVVNEYISHHPDDMASINQCVRSDFVFNTRKYVRTINRTLKNLSTREYILYVDGYVAVHIHRSFAGDILSENHYKYKVPHGRSFGTTGSVGELLQECTYVHGKIHGAHIRCEYRDKSHTLRKSVVRTRTEYDMGVKQGHCIKEVKWQNNLPPPRKMGNFYYAQNCPDAEVTYDEKYTTTSHVVYSNDIIIMRLV